MLYKKTSPCKTYPAEHAQENKGEMRVVCLKVILNDRIYHFYFGGNFYNGT